MRLNCLKGLIGSALFYAICVKGQEYQGSECEKIKDIAHECEESNYGFVTSLIVKENVRIKKGVIANLDSLEKLTLSGSIIRQCNINDIGKLKNLKELTLILNDITKKLDFDPIRENKSIETLQIVGQNDRDYHYKILKENTLKNFKHVKNLNLRNIILSQDDINDIASLSKLKSLSFELCNFKNINIEPLNKLSKLTTVNFDSVLYLQGRTLTNSSLKVCTYDEDDDICIAKDMECLSEELKKVLKTCDSTSGWYDYGKSGYGNSGWSGYGGKNSDDSNYGKSGWSGYGGKNSNGSKYGNSGWSGYSGKNSDGSNYGNSGYGKSGYGKSGYGSNYGNSGYGKSGYGSNYGFSPINKSLPISTDTRCGKKFGTRCPDGQCCSKYNYCGYSLAHCSRGCQSEFGRCNEYNYNSKYPLTTDYRCGKKYGTRCPYGECCSRYGWCGVTKAHCGKGCQSEFGVCN